jgi:hypothetical protein
MSTSGLAERGEFEKALSVDQHGIEPIPESDRDSTSWGDVWFATAREVAEHARSVLDDSGARRLRSALDRGYGMREAGGSDGAT